MRCRSSAVDIAAGEGRDTLELLKRGWKVVATDGHPHAFSYLWPRVPEAWKLRLTTVEVNFAEMEIVSCDLVNANFALPFCEPRHFPGLWDRIVAAIRPGGGSLGNFWETRFLGVDLESDAPLPTGDVALLEGFCIEMIRAEEKNDAPAVRNPKHLVVVSCSGEKVLEGRGWVAPCFVMEIQIEHAGVTDALGLRDQTL